MAIGTYGRWGAWSDSSTSAQQQAQATAGLLSTIAAPLVSQLFNSDPIQAAAIAQANYKNAILSGVSSGQLVVLKAKADAAIYQAQLAQAGTASTTEWSQLGKLGAYTGIGIGVATVIAILATVFKK